MRDPYTGISNVMSSHVQGFIFVWSVGKMFQTHLKIHTMRLKSERVPRTLIRKIKWLRFVSIFSWGSLPEIVRKRVTKYLSQGRSNEHFGRGYFFNRSLRTYLKVIYPDSNPLTYLHDRMIKFCEGKDGKTGNDLIEDIIVNPSE